MLTTDRIPLVRMPLKALEQFVETALAAIGLPGPAAALTRHALVYSELRFHPGQGQGVRRLVAYRDRIAAGAIDARATPIVVKESAALALLDGRNGPGSVIGIEAMRRAVQKAQACGIGAVLVRNGTHYGSSSVHVAEAVDRGCIGLAMTNAGPEMAAWGGATAMVGTNPWGIGAPSDLGFPVILDIALTTAGKGMMRWLAREGQRMPRDWALTQDGEETDDPAAAMAGALLGIGQYKGYGLSFMTDVLTGVLSGGAFGRAPYSDPMRQDVSHLFLAVDIAWFMPLADYQRRLGDFARDIKTSRLRPGFAEVLVPGELEHRRVVEKTRDGVPLDRAVFDDLTRLAHELRIAPPEAIA